MVLTKEDLKILNDLVLYYGSEDIFDTFGKAKLYSIDTKNIRNLAEQWQQKKEIDSEEKPPNIREILDDEIPKIDIENNELKIISAKIDEVKSQEISNISKTDINDVKIHDNYQLDLFALDFLLFSLN